MDDVGCETIGETRVFSIYQCYWRPKGLERDILPDNRDLSLSIFPMEIRRMDSGLDGLASHSRPQIVSDQSRRASQHQLGLVITFPPVSQDEFLQLIEAYVYRIVTLNRHIALSQILFVKLIRMPCSSTTQK